MSSGFSQISVRDMLSFFPFVTPSSISILQLCFYDYSAVLELEEANIDLLEQRLDKVTCIRLTTFHQTSGHRTIDFCLFQQVSKACGLMIDMGKTYVIHQNTFTNSLWDLSSYFKEDPVIVAYLNKLIHPLQEMNKYQTILLDQASRIIMKNLTAFIKK